MKDTFQAKDIQAILEIPKHRYEYLAAKIGIIPEVDEAEGQGRVHLYSYRNVIQFGVADNANNLGLTPKTIKLILSELDNLSQTFDVFKSGRGERMSGINIHYTFDPRLSLIIFGKVSFSFNGRSGHTIKRKILKDYTIKEEIIKVHTIKGSLENVGVNLNLNLLEGIKADSLFQILWKYIKGRVTIHYFKISSDIFGKVAAMK